MGVSWDPAMVAVAVVVVAGGGVEEAGTVLVFEQTMTLDDVESHHDCCV
jgi:hypothetical protein